MKLRMYRTITEGLGYSFHHYDTTARLAWLPLILIFAVTIGRDYVYLSLASGQLVTIFDTSYWDAQLALPDAIATVAQNQMSDVVLIEGITFLLTIILSISFLVPLFRNAMRNVAPPARSAYLGFGQRHFLYFGMQFLASVGIAALVYLPTITTLYFTGEQLTNLRENPFAVFPDAGSLHTIDIEERSTWLFSTFFWFSIAAGVAAFVYLNIRLYLLPALAAVREQGDSYNSFDLTMAITRGWNALRLFLVLVVIFLLTLIASIALNFLIMPLIGIVIFTLGGFVDAAGGVLPSQAAEDGEGGRIFFIYQMVAYVVNMLYLFVVYGINAGIAGSLFRQAEEEGLV